MMKKPLLYSKRTTNPVTKPSQSTQLESNPSQNNLKASKLNHKLINSNYTNNNLKSMDGHNLEDKAHLIAKRISQQSTFIK